MLRCIATGVFLACLCGCQGVWTSASPLPDPADSRAPDPVIILRDAAEIALRQDEHEVFWSDHTLALIADLQVQAGDFEGAVHSIEGIASSEDRNAAFDRTARALARAGQEQAAFEVLKRLGTDHGWSQALLDDNVALEYVQYQIEAGDLAGARKRVDGLTSPASRATALRQLAVAHASAAEQVADGLFQEALDASARIEDEFDRARALWQIAAAQTAVGQHQAAEATVRRVLATARTLRPGTAVVAALREAAVCVAHLGDRQRAEALFQQAIDARSAIGEPLPEANKIVALNLIAQAQAKVGHFEEALRTARLIVHSEEDFTQDSEREEALYAIAVGRAEAGDFAGAAETALSIEYFVQFQDDAMLKIVEAQVTKGDLKGPLKTAKQVGNPSRRATALIKGATAYARRGDRRKARNIAGEIRVPQTSFPPLRGGPEFDYRKPRTWGCLYDEDAWSMTMTSHSLALEKAQDLAAAAMTFAEASGRRSFVPYSVAFKEVPWETVIQALAGAHAGTGNPGEALSWARHIGSSAAVVAKDDFEARSSVKQRIYALIGVAQGILENRGRTVPED